jgi:hypothetical protein
MKKTKVENKADTQELNCTMSNSGTMLLAKCWWFTLVILATKEAEIGRIEDQGQHGKTVHKTLFAK